MTNFEFIFSIPTPSQYVSHAKIDDIANEARKAFKSLSNESSDILDVESYIKLILNKDVIWKKIEETENRICLASIDIDKITLNESHRPLFESRPHLLRSSLAHEVGHDILGHLDLLRVDQDQQLLFDSLPEEEFIFHDSSWRMFSLTLEEMTEFKNGLAKTATVNESDREILRTVEDKLEPTWMFQQAEQFASCFLIPKYRLQALLDTEIDLTSWRTLYALADKFGVSISMMTVRLKKMNMIEIKGKQINLVPKSDQYLF